MRTEELIVRLAQDARPVRPLPSPSVRLARWLAVAVPIIAVGVVVMHPRPDVMVALQDPGFVTRALTTLATALLAAASAFVLSVPGAERSPLHRAMPLLAGGLGVATLTFFLVGGGHPLSRLAALPFNPPCIYRIAGLSLVPGLLLFTMLRRAAPLQVRWNAALAALAAAALSAVGVQMICPVDDPAHQLLGHVLPVMVLTLIGSAVGRRALGFASIRH